MSGVFVMVCADGRDREQVRRAIASGALDVADGFDRVHYLLLASTERELRGLILDSWGISEHANALLRDQPAKASRIQGALTHRTRRE